MGNEKNPQHHGSERDPGFEGPHKYGPSASGDLPAGRPPDSGAESSALPTFDDYASRGSSDGDGGLVHDSLVGVRAGSIRIVGMLARGGMGEVYVGEDEKLGRKVALKALRGDVWRNEGAKARFLQEARVLSRLEHPHICRIYDLVQMADQDFIVLELIQGRSLKNAIGQGLDRAQRFQIARQIAGVLVVAHERGIVHRDLKPDNVLITPEGDVKVLDFGLSRFVSAPATPHPDAAREPDAGAEKPSPSNVSCTQDGIVVGTPGYMCPEQARGDEVSFPGDVYSFGLLLQELFTGVPPYDEALTVTDLVVRTANGESRPAEGLDPDLASLLSRMKALAPGARPSAQDAADRLEWIEGKPRRQRMRRVYASSLVTLALLTAAMILLAVKTYREAERANREARAAEQVSDFLEGLFEVSDPMEMKGPAVTAREILDRGAERVDRQLAYQPLVQARLKLKIGRIYSGLGLYPEAVRQLKEALALRERALGPRDVEVARVLDELGNVRWLQGRFQEAESFLKRALAIKEASLPEDDLELATTLNYLALVLLDDARSSRAEPFLKRALAIRERKLGGDSPAVAVLLHNLGSMYAKQGRYPEAERCLLESLAIRESRLGPDHLQLAPCLDFLSLVRVHQGRLAEAEALNRRSLAIRKKTQGPDHREVAYSVRYLARDLDWSGQDEEAERLYLRDVGLLSKALGEDDPETSAARVRLARFLNERGRFPEGLALAVRALPDLRRGLAGEPSHFEWKVALIEADIQRGIALDGLGRDREARESWMEALALLAPIAKDTDLLAPRAAYAEALLLLGRTEEARPAAEQVLAKGWREPLFLRLCRRAGLGPA